MQCLGTNYMGMGLNTYREERSLCLFKPRGRVIKGLELQEKGEY
ncbi:MAG: hypothetical protein QXU13_05055 [Desulfurococcaceae archaeon]